MKLFTTRFESTPNMVVPVSITSDPHILGFFKPSTQIPEYDENYHYIITGKMRIVVKSQDNLPVVAEHVFFADFLNGVVNDMGIDYIHTPTGSGSIRSEYSAGFDYDSTEGRFIFTINAFQNVAIEPLATINLEIN